MSPLLRIAAYDTVIELQKAYWPRKLTQKHVIEYFGEMQI